MIVWQLENLATYSFAAGNAPTKLRLN